MRFYRFILAVVNVLLFPLYRIRVIGRENIQDGAALICSNHTGYTDPIFIAHAYRKRHQIHFMAKAELMHIPLLGGLLRRLGTFGVDRGHSDITAIKTALQYLKSGEKVAMFPQGTRVDEGDASAAKTGAILLASRAKVPIVPVYMPGHKHVFSRVQVVIGEPYMLNLEKNDHEGKAAAAEELMEKINGLKEKLEA